MVVETFVRGDLKFETSYFIIRSKLFYNQILFEKEGRADLSDQLLIKKPSIELRKGRRKAALAQAGLALGRSWRFAASSFSTICAPPRFLLGFQRHKHFFYAGECVLADADAITLVFSLVLRYMSHRRDCHNADVEMPCPCTGLLLQSCHAPVWSGVLY